MLAARTPHSHCCQRTAVPAAAALPEGHVTRPPAVCGMTMAAPEVGGLSSRPL